MILKREETSSCEILGLSEKGAGYIFT